MLRFVSWHLTGWDAAKVHQGLAQERARPAHGIKQGAFTVPFGLLDNGSRNGFLHRSFMSYGPVAAFVEGST